MTSRSLEDLHPDFAIRVTAWIAEVEAERDWSLLVYGTFRSPVDQADEFTAGRSKAPPWASAHQFGLGVDVVPVQNKLALWKYDLKGWEWLAAMAAKRGIDWPAMRSKWMKRVDPYHFQHPDFVTNGSSKLLERLRQNLDMLRPEAPIAWRPKSFTESDLLIKAPWE